MRMRTALLGNSVFVYGTLMAPEVIETLLGRVPPMTSARLTNYVRHPVKQQVFPGLIAKQNHITTGYLVQNLQDSELIRLDWFEDKEYKRLDCVVETLEDGKSYRTQVYLWNNPLEELDISQEWDYEHFRGNNLQWYLTNTVEPCRTELDRRKI